MSQPAKWGFVDIAKVFEVANDGEQDGQCLFTGNHFGEYYNAIILEARKRFPYLNCTIAGYEQFGSLNDQTGLYTGIAGAVQSGEIDVSVLPIYYPVNDKNNSIRYASVMSEDTMTIMSLYNMTDTKYDTDILSMFGAVPIDLWYGLFITFIILAIVLMIGDKLLGWTNHPNPFWTIFRAFLDDDNFSSDGLFYLVFGVVSSSMLFFAIEYLTNSVSSDLVVIDKPIVIQSYDDVFAHKAFTMLSEKVPEYEKFANARKNSIAGKLYEHRIEYTVDIEFVDLFLDKLLTQKAVVLGREMVAKAIAIFIKHTIDQTQKNKLKNIRVLLSRDKNARKFTNIFIGHKKDDTYTNFVVSSTYNMFEFGLLLHGYETAADECAEQVIGMNFPPSFMRSISYKIEEEEAEYRPVSMRNIYFFLKCLFSCFVISSIILILEGCIWGCSRSKKSKIRIKQLNKCRTPLVVKQVQVKPSHSKTLSHKLQKRRISSA